MAAEPDNNRQRVEEKLRDEGKNRKIWGRDLELCDCLVHCLNSRLEKVDRNRASQKAKTELNKLDKLTDVVEMKRTIEGVMRELKEILKQFVHLLIDRSPQEVSTSFETVDTIYENMITQWISGRVDHSRVKLCLFAAATGIKTTIYLIDDNLQWEVFQPLFGNDLTLDYIAMYKSNDKFYVIESPDRYVSPPKARGLLGKLMDQVENHAAEFCPFLNLCATTTSESQRERKLALRKLDYAILHKNESVSSFIKRCRLIRKDLDDRRKGVTDVVIKSSGAGIISSGMVAASVLMVPFTGGVSLGLGIGGGLLGIGSGAVTFGYSAHETHTQIRKLDEIETLQAIVSQKEKEVSAAWAHVVRLFDREIRTQNLDMERIERKICGHRMPFAVIRSADGAVDLALAVAKFGGRIGKGIAFALAPVSLALDISVMVEAIRTKSEGNKTEAGIILEKTARYAEIKHVLFNSIWRGDWDSRFLLCTDYHE